MYYGWGEQLQLVLAMMIGHVIHHFVGDFLHACGSDKTLLASAATCLNKHFLLYRYILITVSYDSFSSGETICSGAL